MKQKVLVAFDDVDEIDEIFALASKLSPWVGGFKISAQIDRYGVSVIPQLKEYGLVMSDVKICDIPTQAARRVELHANAGADFITVHASGGKKMLQACTHAAPTQIIVVTVLSSLLAHDTHKIFGGSIRNRVRYFAHLAFKSHAAGIVCAPHDLRYLDEDTFASDFVRITPNIRPLWSHVRSDQNDARAMTPQDAFKNGAQYVVIGRPITSALDQVEAARRVLHDIEGALESTK